MKNITAAVEDLAMTYVEMVKSGEYSQIILNARKEGMADALYSVFGKPQVECRQWISSHASTIIRKPFYEYFSPLTRGHDIDAEWDTDIWYSTWKKKDDGTVFEIIQRRKTKWNSPTTIVKTNGEWIDDEIASSYLDWHDAEESILRQLIAKYYGSDQEE